LFEAVKVGDQLVVDEVQFGRATGLFPENIVDVLEYLFKQGFRFESRSVDPT
jgi:hypothetical protein